MVRRDKIKETLLEEMLQMVKEFRVDRTVVSTVQANNRCKDLQINFKVLQDQPKPNQTRSNDYIMV